MHKQEIKTLADRIHWVTLCKEWKERWDEPIPESEDINIYSFIEKLNASMTAEWYIVTDAGSAFYTLSQRLKLLDEQKFVVSASQADMGCALPASIGVALANPNKKILCITGDGSFNSNLQELAVIKYHNLPIKIFVLDNKGYLSIRNTQQKFFDGRVYGTSDSKGLWFPSIDKVAETYDMNWIALKDLNCDLTEIVNTDTPTIVQVFCSFNQEVIPTQALKQQGDKQVQAPLEDMYPFMSEETFRKEKLRALQGVPWEQ